MKKYRIRGSVAHGYMAAQLLMKSALITPEGYQKLQQEHDELWFKKRPEVTKIVSWAASLGDRSENGDYIYNKQLLRQIDRRIRYLRKRLDELQIVRYNAQQNGKVFFGAFVEIENEDGVSKTLRIVGPDEIYSDDRSLISVNSPMARALIGKMEDDDIEVRTPSGPQSWYINKIWYGNAD